MKNNYKNIVFTIVLTAASVVSEAAVRADGTSVWFAGAATGGLTALQAQQVSADTATFWNGGEPNNSSEEDCAVQQASGGWNDLSCTNNASRRAACFNGSDWALSNSASTSRTTATGSCPSGYVYAAPQNLQQRSALSARIVAAGAADVWINALDNATEGVWVFNAGTTSVFAPFWNAGEPNNSGSAEHCAEVLASGLWNDQSCGVTRPVVCANTDFTAWNIANKTTTTLVAFNSPNELHGVCQQAFGNNWNFAAPRTLAERNALSAVLSSESVASAWVNARDSQVEGYWMLNHGLFNWAASQPDFNTGICATIRQTDGKWISADCDSEAKLLCSDGPNWALRNFDHQFSNQALDACSRPDTETLDNPYVNYRLKTPVTEGDRSRAGAQVQAAGNGIVAWLNIKRVTDVNRWLINEDYRAPVTAGGDLRKVVWYDLIKSEGGGLFNPNPTFYDNWRRYEDGVTINRQQAVEANKQLQPYFRESEPNNSGACVQLYISDGLWDDTGCGNSKRVACFNGSRWAISPDATGLTETNENTIVASGNAACAQIPNENGATGDYKFAAPLSFQQSQLLQAVAADAGAGDVWINANDKKYANTFVFNLDMDVMAPFWGAGEPNDFGGNEDCAVQRSDGLWNDLNCASAQRIACYNPWLGANGTWKVTAANYTFSSPDQMTLQCEAEFGGQYKFYAPETLSQRNALQAAKPAGVNDVFINADDQQSEGTWQLNKDINNWAAGQPSTSTSELCVAASATDSQWRARNCTQALPVACTSGGRWYFTNDPITLNDFANGQEACSAFGNGYLFNAPRSLNDARIMQHQAKLAGIGGEYWINGNRLENFATWEWNQRRLKTPLWSSVEPNGSTSENCAVLTNNQEGSWADERCNTASNYAYLCRNGNNWQASVITGSLADFSAGVSACQALGNGWVFAAPATYNENLAAKNAMGGAAKVWLNATDAMKEGAWVLNAAPIATYPGWAAGQPDNAGINAADETALVTGEDCVYQSADGYWYDTSCTAATEYPWACTDGYVWKVTQSQGRAQKPADGHKACFSEYGSTFVFAAPLNKNDSIQIDFARLLAESERASPMNAVWLNMNDGAYEDNRSGAADGRHFRKNQPYTNWVDAYPGVEPVNTCAYKSTTAAGTNNPWRSGSCSNFAAHYACTNGAGWKVATSKGTLVNGSLQITPQVGEDFWSYERGTRLCKEQFGAEYYFAAPVTAAEDLALDAAIRNTNAQVKNTWINYYFVNAINPEHNPWFSNRMKTGIWQKPEFRNLNNSDCAVLHNDGSWTDVPCNSTYAFACFDGSWKVTGNGQWSEGFAACDNNLGGSLFAVPRTPDEMEQLLANIGAEPVWINFTDTALESQWIANRLRFTWWKAGEPSNSFNRDCARIGTDGEWYAGRCSIEQAAFACRRIAGNNIEWFVTTGKGTWAEGFGYCASEFPGSEFYTPQGFANNSAKADQLVLAAAVAAAGQDAWLNLSDQEAEGSWRSHQAYNDWGVSSLIDQNNDCAYLSRVASGTGTWYADNCKYTASAPVSRGYACTDGYEWKLVNTAADTSMRWSEGFSACQTLGTNWRYAAPADAVNNAKLKLAMELGGLEQVWVNAQDRTSEGNWQVNGPETNFAPAANLSAVATVVAENTSNIQLLATLEDDEEMGVASASWTLVSDSRFADVASSDIVVSNNNLVTGAAGSATVTASYSTPVLLKDDVILTFRLTATDIPPGTAVAATSETFVTVRVKAPLLAGWNFNNSALPQQDFSGNKQDALNTVSNPMPSVVNGALSVSPGQRMVVPGLAAKPNGGLDIPADEYSVAFRISIEDAPTGNWRGILQKGDSGLDRQPGVFLYPNDNTLHSSNSTSASSNQVVNIPGLPDRQWLNVVYNKSADGFDIYIDGDKAGSFDFAAGETSVGNNGNFYVGQIPGAAESFTGLIDDIQIFNRQLSAAEITAVLPPPPAGVVQFSGSSVQVDEDSGSVTVALERSRGSKEPLTVYVDLDTANSTATLGTQADMATATNPADLAFGAAYVNGTGMPVSWPANTRGTQNVVITLDNADDEQREGTEIARLRLADLANASAGQNSTFNLRLNDVTPNPYGNFSVVAPDPAVVLETNSAVQQICIQRESGSQGEVNVNYSISGSAVAGTDFNYQTSGIVPTANSGTVIFADGDSADQCFDVVVTNDTAINGADRTLTVSLTGLNHAAGLDPILTMQNQAQLFIRDYAPGEFAFETDSYECKEPNTSVAVPDDLRAGPGDLVCEIRVKRSNTSVYAPAATLNVVAPASTGYSFTSQLQWHEITPVTPATTATETQVITFTIANDDVQENEEVVAVNLAPTNGDGHNEVIAATNGVANLTIVDVTSPALVIINENIPPVFEGQKLVVDIQRSENPATDFDVSRYVEVLNKAAGKTDSDYLAFEYSSPALQSGTINFDPIAAVPQNSQLIIRTKDVLFNNNDYQVRVTLQNPAPSRVVGLGSLTSANKDNDVNKTFRDFVISNDISVNDLISLSSTALNNNAEAGGKFYPIDNFLGARAKAQVSFTVPPRESVNKKHNIINYRWEWINANGAVFTTGATTSGNFAYTDAMNESARTRSISVDLPYTSSTDILSQLRLTVWGGNSTNMAEADEVYVTQENIITTPRWRRLKFGSDRCVAFDSGDGRYEANNCANSVVAGELWTYNPISNQMINKGDNACADGTGDLGKKACNENPTTWTLVKVGGSLNVKRTADGEKWCRIWPDQRINVRNLTCTGEDDLFVWGEDQ